MFYRDTWAEINLSKITGNIQTVRKLSGKDLFAVIKANGYGCGDVVLAKTAMAAGASYLAVSSLDEALHLRHAGIDHPILVLEYMNPAALPVAKAHHITATASSSYWVEEALAADTEGLKVHIKVDTGMNRIGFTDFSEIGAALDALTAKGLEVEGIYTHFACSDDPNNTFCQRQLVRFESILAKLGRNFRWIHCANTDAAVHFHENISNAVRCGIGMLGVSSYDMGLAPVLALYSRIVHVKQVPKGQTIGYGATYETPEDEWIATIPIGYADGWLRRHQGRCCVVDGQECQFVGRICMDQAMIRLPRYYPIGTTVELIGPSMPVTRVAEETGTITYEIFTTLNERIAKVYIKN
jgi:alanine racemase